MAEPKTVAATRLPALPFVSIAISGAYMLLWGQSLPDALLVTLKGLPVGLLAVDAACRARSIDGWLLTAVLALGAAGDILLEIVFEIGAAAFALGHLVAALLYLRNRRPLTTTSFAVRWLPLLILPAAVVAPRLLLGAGHPTLSSFTLYAAIIALMVTTALYSCFPRRLTGLGALLFLLSDLLIAARMGPHLNGSERQIASYAIWTLYYLGQLLIYLGVSRGLATTIKPSFRSFPQPS